VTIEPGEPRPVTGLTSEDVAVRVRAGQTNAAAAPSSRSTAEILRANVFTFFNGLLAVLLVVILVFGNWRDGLFGFVLISNMAIGIIQELRAKYTLDRLSLIAAPQARVVRDGAVLEIAVSNVVLDDVIQLRSGDQVVADGEVLETAGLEIDEALLTGESKPVLKAPGDRVMSGSVCVAGSGAMRATAVGAEAYARRLASEARRFHRTPSELRRSTDRIIKTTAILIVPVAALLLARRWPTSGDLHVVVPETVAALVGMIPQGLVLLTSIAFAVSVIKLARRQTLIEELSAVEILARVDVVCLDKTGTITEPGLDVRGIELLGPTTESQADAALSALACIDPPESRNSTARALAEKYGESSARPRAAVPFSSARKWSAVDLGPDGCWVLGAPEFVLREGDPARDMAAQLARKGARVVLLARVEHLPAADGSVTDPSAAALVRLEERVRADAAETLAYFRAQGVALKVISGDSQDTVASAALRAGLEHIGEPVDGSRLPTDPAELADFMETHSIFGRIRPEQKRDMVTALQARGHVVAMTGDGVNDVLALKTADLGIAMGSGAAASRAVAEVVLLDSRFSRLPDVLAEGRRVMANVERVANLFVTKSVYAAQLAIGAGIFAGNYPLLPRHFTLIDALTIGIPGFFLALEPAAPRYRPGFLRRVMRFTLAAGIVVTAATAISHGWADGTGASDPSSRTVAVMTIVPLGLWILATLARPLNGRRIALVAAMAAAFGVTLVVPFARTFFALPPGPAGTFATVTLTVLAACSAVELALHTLRWKPPGSEEPSA
jgi:cation-transporting ATPase E